MEQAPVLQKGVGDVKSLDSFRIARVCFTMYLANNIDAIEKMQRLRKVTTAFKNISLNHSNAFAVLLDANNSPEELARDETALVEIAAVGCFHAHSIDALVQQQPDGGTLVYSDANVPFAYAPFFYTRASTKDAWDVGDVGDDVIPHRAIYMWPKEFCSPEREAAAATRTPVLYGAPQEPQREFDVYLY
jgi:hypothetical protein